MPRDGSNVYSRPFPNVEAGTTIESAVYNGFTADVATEFNTPRPLVAGGTGATNALDAMIALKGEVAQQTVSNFDSYPFVSGSFSATTAASGSPVSGHAFSGVAYVTDIDNMVIEARDVSDGNLYVRRKVSGAWVNSGAWSLDGAPYVKKVGDSMSGTLTISPATGPANIYLNKAASGTDSIIYGATNGKSRWAVDMGNSVAEGGSNAGSNFAIYRYADDGSFLGAFVDVLRSSGAVTINGVTTFSGVVNANAGANVNGSLTVAYSATQGTIYFGTNGAANSKYLTYDGSNYTLAGGTLFTGAGAVASDAYMRATGGYYYEGSNVVRGYWDGSRVRFTHGIQTGGDFLSNNNIYANYSSANTATYYFGNDASKYLTCDGATYTFGGGAVTVNGNLNVNSGGGRAEIAGSGTQGQLRLYDTNTGWAKHLRSNSSSFEMVNSAYSSVIFQVNDGGDVLNLSGQHYKMGVANPFFINGSSIFAGGLGYACRNGYTVPGGYNANCFNLFWNGTYMYCFVDNVNLGGFSFISDYRVKKDVIDLPGMWDTVKKLRPIKYQHKDFSPPSHVAHVAEIKKTRAKEDPVPDDILVKADGVERWGFMAHELQETLLPSVASADKDAPDALQSPNPMVVVAALTKALQEAMARIEALEGVEQWK